ncbi:MAG: SAM-dependent methyltransferase, partial [Lachnospiraceae bacterium]|nr:SAM-dependent methyltransferase [Candidatus Equihabitans merdae]
SYQTRCTSIGIEYDERIYETALRNGAEAVSGKRVTFLCQDAVNYEIPPEVDRVFFFNPFSVEILQSVLGNVLASYYAFPREILLMFYFPSDEYIGALMTNDALEFEDEISCEDLFDENADRERIIIFRVSEI